MTSIALDGGPSLAQRRAFAALKDGSQVPGYRGYCPQLKYRVGKRYGQDTFELSQTYEHRNPLTNSLTPTQTSNRPPLKNELPDSTGDNKYTKKMVPGYTGYIPRWPFKFGATYKEDCDVCIDEHITNYKKHTNKQNDIRMLTRSQTMADMRPVRGDPEVRDHLNTYRDTHPAQPILLESKRGKVEPPIPGYQGYVPRIYTTELGLGVRYNEMTRNGLEAFNAEQEFYRQSQSAPISINRLPGTVGRTAKANTYSKRLYEQDGMIPKYTGYVPQRRYAIGKTYGDTTRSLDVCAHDKSCFGEYMSTQKSLPMFIC